MKFHRTLFKAIDYINDGATNPNIAKKCNKEQGRDLVVKYDERYSDRTNDCLADYYYYEKDDLKQKYPVLIYIHGGGFVAGDKKYRRALGAWYANLGMFVINVNYSLCDKQKFPIPVLECVDALNHVEKISDKYNLDTDNIIISGDSAGAYYASMVAAISSNKELLKRFGLSACIQVKAVVLNCGIYDIATALKVKYPFDLCNQICLDFTGYSSAVIEELDFYDMMSPIPYISAGYPTPLLIHAKNDVFCSGQTPELIKALQANGVKYYEYYSRFVFDNHCYCLTWGTHTTKKTMECIKNFVTQLIKN